MKILEWDEKLQTNKQTYVYLKYIQKFWDFHTLSLIKSQNLHDTC